MVSLLRNQHGFDVIGEASDGEQAARMALQFRPDVVLIDFSMPLLNGVDATRKIKAAAPGIAVIGLTMFSDADTAQRMLNAGAKGFLAKDVQPRHW
jgi:DNA-binding NarL/FixJ family response regulator